MTDETEDLRKRVAHAVEEMRQEVHSMPFVSAPPVDAATCDLLKRIEDLEKEVRGLLSRPAVERWKPDFFSEKSPFRGLKVYKDLPCFQRLGHP